MLSFKGFLIIELFFSCLRRMFYHLKSNTMKDNTMKRGGKMKKIFQLGMLVFVGLMGFFVLQPSIAFGQTFVRDDAGVL